ncbi:MAG TPA: hypothetical protein PKA64_21770 [Myxococcota bacterium]|nr:hypothetical protein [Myxococcota bacterium]
MPTPTRLPLAAVALLACAGEVDHACTEIGCADGLVIELDHTWTEGDYTFEVSLDGQVITCTASIPFGEGDGCADDRALLSLSGTMLPVDQQTIPSITVTDGDVTTVGVRVLMGDTELTNATLTPAWSTSQPNGPDCPPTCRTADETITF